MHVAVLTLMCVKGSVVNQHALTLYTDASFLVTLHKPENWTLQGAQHSFLSAENFQLLLLPLTASAGSWKEQQVPFIFSEEASIILLLCRSGIYILHYGKLLDLEDMYLCLTFAYIHI